MNAGRFRVFCLWLADVACIASIWTLIVFGYKQLGFGDYHAHSYFRAWPIIFVFTGINWVGKLYHGRGSYPSMPLPQVEEFRRLLLSAVATHVLVMAFLGFSGDAEAISKFVLVTAGILTALFAQVYRDGVRGILKKLGLGQIPAFVVGSGRAAEHLIRRFHHDCYYGFKIVRTFGDQEKDTILSAAEMMDVKHLFCCYKDARYFRLRLKDFLERFHFIEYIPLDKDFPVADARPMQIGGLGGMEMINQRRMKMLAFQKSCVNRVLSLLILILSIPFFIIVPILIKLTSRGPVFYKAHRLGKKGRAIVVWKFRSMYADADERLEAILTNNPELREEYQRTFKLKKDPRVTPLGKLLRKASIDELPQLINVFRGEMALVGPRPIVEREVAYYGQSYEIFSSVKPGITGLWQVSGRSDCDYEERVALDVHYILNWSPWMDLWIIYRTAAAVLKMKGCY